MIHYKIEKASITLFSPLLLFDFLFLKYSVCSNVQNLSKVFYVAFEKIYWSMFHKTKGKKLAFRKRMGHLTVYSSQMTYLTICYLLYSSQITKVHQGQLDLSLLQNCLVYFFKRHIDHLLTIPLLK